MGNIDVKSTTVGVVGLGLMGSSIVLSLLASGHRVVALAPISGEKERAAGHIAALLRHADSAGILQYGIAPCVDRMKLVEDYSELALCQVVLECVIEDKEIKKIVYERIADSVATDTIIASNTSAIPISELQVLVPHPQRFLGVHWAEPAYMTRFLEVTCGKQTDPEIADYIMRLGIKWGKEPTLLKKDIRGFITNRLMYAVFREAFCLAEAGHITLSDSDKAFRYDMGSWVTLMGIFRRMDFMGTTDYIKGFGQLFAMLSNSTEVPVLMQQIVEQRGRGVHNMNGLYEYTQEEAKTWDHAFARFNRDIYELAEKYPEQG
ncbi:3-hydroxyacyl-CoA dehydrogenase family protein [Parapedobacter pyrenivorans]|uniref:3-hydroxyacyl-CoA dehydrogenase family protein n=1 Tax=Parapedobacter pyrenivorans TaxID=1305674 RepID=UPI0033414DF1